MLVWTGLELPGKVNNPHLAQVVSPVSLSSKRMFLSVFGNGRSSERRETPKSQTQNLQILKTSSVLDVGDESQ